MTHSVRSTLLLLLLCGLPAAAHSSEYMLFSPRPLEGELLLPERGKGVLVKRITIKEGDTLSQISQDFSGRGSYFPQILLFNNIPNPDRIRAGRELVVPVSKQGAIATKSAPVEKTPQPVARKPKSRPAPEKVQTTAPAQKTRLKSYAIPAQRKQLPTGQPADKSAQDAYSRAINAYRTGEYQKSLSLFSRFLAQYPSSPLAADAALYKAECLFKLSGQ